jgi:hypothetical protein
MLTGILACAATFNECRAQWHLTAMVTFWRRHVNLKLSIVGCILENHQIAHTVKVKGEKSKVNLVTGHAGWGFKAPMFSKQPLSGGGEFGLTALAALYPRNILGITSVRGLVGPSAIVRLQGLG